MRLNSLAFPWRAWLTIAVLSTVFFGFTLTTAVPVWTDESLIVEAGRVTLNRNPSDLSFRERSDSGRPLYPNTVLSAIAAEIAARTTQPSNFGLRAFALWGQLAAAGFFIYYLCLYGLEHWGAILIGIAFLLDPLCDMSWRAGRIDGWTFAILFAALCVLRRTGLSGQRHSFQWGPLLAGALVAAGFSWWPSFMMLLPLLLLELPALMKDRSKAIQAAGLFAGGFILASAAVVLPFQQQISYGLRDARFLTVLQSQESWSGGMGPQIRALVSVAALTPVAALTGVAALFRGRSNLLLVGFLIAFAVTLATMISRSRVLYLVPYFYLAVSSIFWQSPPSLEPSRWRRAGTWAIAIMLMLGIAFTVVGTTMSGLSNRAGKDPMVLLEPARAAIGAGPIGVFLNDPDLYYTGRALGWRQFHCFDACWGPEPPSDKLRSMLSRMEVAVFRGEPEPSVRALIHQAGFEFSTVILPQGGHRSRIFGWGYGPSTYGPYFIYRRSFRQTAASWN
jgi:hypothetical protein